MSYVPVVITAVTNHQNHALLQLQVLFHGEIQYTTFEKSILLNVFYNNLIILESC